ncbi:ABC transporter G family member 23-like isoform X3 [Temnothorax curvispinosus]|uniref:ABC transporter G family member 23-like isoform X3 n=1 Tax=Temnothorax curvispinosus TaxID=300111 RepID=A0A6J1QRJ9_9HYME|nr:ABC transporter G family member 23-like isoform X3 [Temnothorax curvispinosus]
MVQQEAVVVRNAVKRYGKGQPVLDCLNMTVSRGSIYGLLGASGCGKTTLLSCVVGVRYLDSGEVWVLGGNPGGKGSGIPGPQVGYMPQDISLVGEFTMSDALYYFGRINGLDDEKIETRQRFFSKLLQLPPADHLVKNMSGGQQRRVSFAAALIHSPELLILDEPTVGLDPILRENIWGYLIEITQKEGITVLITTHYIEETKNASKIGLMRCGKLLAESPPQKLLEQFQCSFLEEAFLKLCKGQNDAIILNETQESKAKDTGSGSELMNQDRDKYEQTKGNSEYKTVSRRKVSRSKRFKALLAKNGIQFLRYYAGLAFAVTFPIVQVTIFLVAIGADPKDLKIGVVNDEASNCDYGSNLGNIWNDEITCHFGNLSCRFLHNFDDSIAIKKYYDNILEARHDVQNGELMGIIYFNQNFSEALQIRVEIFNFAKDSDLLASQIHVFLDMGDRQVGLITQKKLFDRFLEVYEDIMRDCKYSPKLATPPIRFEDPIYGTTDLNYTDYVTPSFMLTQYSLHHLDSNRAIRRRLGSKRSPSGFTGLMYGFIVSIGCKNHTMATYCSAGSFFPIILLNGGMWPLEGMPKILRWFSYIVPTTLPSISLRGLIYKGSSITDSEVYFGLLISLGWILLFFIITILGVRSKSS